MIVKKDLKVSPATNVKNGKKYIYGMVKVHLPRDVIGKRAIVIVIIR